MYLHSRSCLSRPLLLGEPWRYECSGAGGVMVGWTSLSIDGKTVIELCYARLSGGVDIAFSITESRKKKFQISLLFNQICLEYLCKTKYNQNKSKNKLSLNNGPTFFFGLLTYPYSSLRELGVDNISVLFIRILCHSFCFH